MTTPPRLLVIMGVSGVGKTTIVTLLAEQLAIPFADGDDFHPEENIQKMSEGNPLSDEDRYKWLEALNKVLQAHQNTGLVLACSALKSDYRVQLSAALEDLTFIFLKGTFDEVKSRLKSRKGHFMPLELLASQFEALETPEGAITVSILDTPEAIVQQIIDQL